MLVNIIRVLGQRIDTPLPALARRDQKGMVVTGVPQVDAEAQPARPTFLNSPPLPSVPRPRYRHPRCEHGTGRDSIPRSYNGRLQDGTAANPPLCFIMKQFHFETASLVFHFETRSRVFHFETVVVLACGLVR